MPTSVRRAIVAILFLVAVGGLVSTTILASQVFVPAGASDDALADRVSKYLTVYVDVEREGERYERVEPYLIGQAREALDAEKNSAAAGIPGLQLQTSPKVTVLWRGANQAMAEATLSLTDDAGVETVVGEHLLLVFADGQWRISTVWRVTPNAPITPVAGATPTPGPAVTPAP